MSLLQLKLSYVLFCITISPELNYAPKEICPVKSNNYNFMLESNMRLNQKAKLLLAPRCQYDVLRCNKSVDSQS